MVLHLIPILIAAIGVVGIQLPNVTGPYPVGTVSFELIDEARIDPFAPTPQPRDIMVSVYYPTTKTAVKSGNYSFAPYFNSPLTAAAFNYALGNSSEIMKIITQAYHKAPIMNSSFPVLIFSHGLGGSRFMYRAQLTELASCGWIIIAPDHPYDAIITVYPNGNFVEMPQSALDNFPNELPPYVEARVADVGFLASAFKNSTTLSQIPGLISSGGTLLTDQIGIFGHSLGGCTAAQAMVNYSTFPCGVNYDGGIYGPVEETGLDKPFLQIEAENHWQDNDTTFDGLYDNLRGFRREYIVNGTVHFSYMDTPLLRDLLGPAYPVELWNYSGTIAGKRLLDIEVTMMDAFFSFCLKGKSADKLDSLPQGRFPEVWIPPINYSFPHS